MAYVRMTKSSLMKTEVLLKNLLKVFILKPTERHFQLMCHQEGK